MKTKIINTPTGKIVKLGDVVDSNRAWKRAERKAGCSFTGFYNGLGAESGSPAVKTHFQRQRARSNFSPGRSHLARRIQSRAAKILDTVGHPPKNTPWPESIRALWRFAHRGPALVVPVRVLPLP